MSIATGDNQLETAAFSGPVPTGAGIDVAETVEATEDREIHFVQVFTSEAEVQAWVQFGTTTVVGMGSGVAAADPTASGILGGTRGEDGASTVDLSSAPPIWNAGEDLAAVADNVSGSEAIVMAIVGYVPVGEFRRSSLRNSD